MDSAVATPKISGHSKWMIGYALSIRTARSNQG
jgi:hypothetical protein